MKTSVTKLLQRTAFVFVATLIVAAHPALASADTTSPATIEPTTTQSSTAADTGQLPATTPPADTTPATAAAAQSDAPKPETDPSPADQPKTADPNSVAPTTTSTTTTDTTTKAGIQNTMDSTAKTGNATVVNNTTAGDATSGGAGVNNTSINMLQSSAGFGGGSTIATFTKDIDGNQTGDILLNPDLLASIAVAPPSSSPPTDLTVTSQTSGQIHNTINLDAQSGNATVANNGTAGNATTGDANAVANIVNMVNSMVGADHTFVGTININGSLDGDILLPDVMQNLLGSATPTDGNLELHNTTAQSVANNVTTSAQSGNATVTNNGEAGNATTGEAKTNVTIMNLSSAHAVGKDSIVVFVNILGSWVGFIVDSPTGTDSAVLGDGITSSNPATGNTVINNSSDIGIVNDVRVNAASGNATVANNGTAGNATTGKATASANILNLTNSSISMGGWFGILFINVFGSWHGSFGVDTAAGNPSPQQPDTPPSSDTASGTNGPTQTFVAAAHFAPTTTNDPSDISTPANDSTKHKDVLSASTARFIPPLHTNSNHWQLPAVGLTFSLLLVLCEIILSRRKKLHTAVQGIAN